MCGKLGREGKLDEDSMMFLDEVLVDLFMLICICDFIWIIPSLKIYKQFDLLVSGFPKPTNAFFFLTKGFLVESATTGVMMNYQPKLHAKLLSGNPSKLTRRLAACFIHPKWVKLGLI